MTIPSDFHVAVNEAKLANPTWRYGQAAFNVLWQMRPDLADQIRATPLDPFHNPIGRPWGIGEPTPEQEEWSEKLNRFYEWLGANW